MRRLLPLSILVLASSLGACGDDAEPDRTIAFVRTSPVPAASQEALLEEIVAAGWTDGENLTVLNEDTEAIFSEEELADAVDGFVAEGADLLVALSTSAARAAMENDNDVPVLVVANDPVASGLVVNPRAPDGLVTGISFQVPSDRTIDLARQLVGADHPLGLLHPDNATAAPIVGDMRDAAASLGVQLVVESFVSDDDVRSAVSRLSEAGVAAVMLVNAPETVAAHDVIEQAAAAARMPVIANTNVNSFAVLVLAPDNIAVYGQLGRQAARLLGGADVDEVPLEEPARYNLVVRAAIAEQLGVELTEELLARADEVSG